MFEEDLTFNERFSTGVIWGKKNALTLEDIPNGFISVRTWFSLFGKNSFKIFEEGKDWTVQRKRELFFFQISWYQDLERKGAF